MRISESCEACLLEKQTARVSGIVDEARRQEYLRRVREILENRKETDTSPYMVYQFNKAYEALFGKAQDYAPLKRTYNDLVLSMEEQITAQIHASEDALEQALIDARIGNYIDFGALSNVDSEAFVALFDRTEKERLDRDTYQRFRNDMKNASSFLLVCDNCGEIVLDKLFLRELKRTYPRLTTYALVRGGEVLNDATREDAVYTGLDQEAVVLTNGMDFAGTVIGLLPEKTREILLNADVILAKGQGNYETLSGCGLNVYYSLLCKCDLFVKRFRVPFLSGMFVHEGALPQGGFSEAKENAKQK